MLSHGPSECSSAVWSSIQHGCRYGLLENAQNLTQLSQRGNHEQTFREVDRLVGGLLPVAGDGDFASHGQSPGIIERSEHDLGHNHKEVEEEKEYGHDANSN
jgi:hypothetical protein